MRYSGTSGLLGYEVRREDRDDDRLVCTVHKHQEASTESWRFSRRGSNNRQIRYLAWNWYWVIRITDGRKGALSGAGRIAIYPKPEVSCILGLEYRLSKVESLLQLLGLFKIGGYNFLKTL